MTRPISEVRDKTAEAHYAVRQLQRRPAPVPETAGNTYPWMALENLGQTLPSGVDKYSLFTDAWWDPNLLTGDPLDSGADDDTYFSLEVDTEDTLDFFVLRTKLEGWYRFQYISSFGQFSSPPGTAGHALIYVNLPTTGIHFELDKNMREAKDWATGAVENELVAAARVDIDGRDIYLPASKLWDGVKCNQTSAADRDFQAHLKVWYMGHFGSTTTDNANWEFAQV